MVTEKEAFNRLRDIYSPEGFEKEISRRFSEYSGFLNPDAIASILLSENGRYIIKEYSISGLFELKDTEIVCVSGRVDFISQDRMDVYIDDGTGKAKLRFSTTVPEEIQTDEIIRVINVEWRPRGRNLIFQENSEFRKENNNSNVRQESVMTVFEKSAAALLNINGKLIMKSDTKTFRRKGTDEPGKYMIMVLEDSVKKTSKILFWDFSSEMLKEFIEGQMIMIKNLRQKINNESIEFHSTEGTFVSHVNNDAV